MAEAFRAQPSAVALRALNYAPAVEQLRRAGRRVPKLGDLAQTIGPAYATVFARLDCDFEHGIELLSQSDMFAAEPRGRVIRKDSMSRPDRYRIERYQILMAGAGTLGETELYGRSIIADDRLAGRYVGQDTMTVSFEQPGGDLNLYVYAFLCSPTGVRAVRSCSYGTKILRYRRTLFESLPIPLPSTRVMGRVAGLIRKCVEQRELYLSELKAARKVIEDLPEMQEAHAICPERRRQTVVWRGALRTMSAWNHASTGESLQFLSSQWRGRLTDHVRRVAPKIRFPRIECDPPHGVDFVSQRDIFMVRRIPRRLRAPSQDGPVGPGAGTLLIARDGQMTEGALFGSCALADHELSNSLVSEHVLQLAPAVGSSELLYAYLSTPLGKRLLRTTGVGTSIPTIREDLLLALPVPTLGADSLARVRRHVSSAMAARRGAGVSEAEATRIIEEEVLPEWLD